MSVTDAVLREDPAGCYSAMTFDPRDHYRHAVEELAKRREAPEPSVAARGDRARDGRRRLRELGSESSGRERVSHVGYYLVGRGRTGLEQRGAAIDHRSELALRGSRRHPAPFYFGALAAATHRGPRDHSSCRCRHSATWAHAHRSHACSRSFPRARSALATRQSARDDARVPPVVCRGWTTRRTACRPACGPSSWFPCCSIRSRRVH